jgi:hypothetical protein
MRRMPPRWARPVSKLSWRRLGASALHALHCPSSAVACVPAACVSASRAAFGVKEVVRVSQWYYALHFIPRTPPPPPPATFPCRLLDAKAVPEPEVRSPPSLATPVESPLALYSVTDEGLPSAASSPTAAAASAAAAGAAATSAAAAPVTAPAAAAYAVPSGVVPSSPAGAAAARSPSSRVLEALVGTALLQGCVGLFCVAMGGYMGATDANRSPAIAVLMVAGAAMVPANVAAFMAARTYERADR